MEVESSKSGLRFEYRLLAAGSRLRRDQSSRLKAVLKAPVRSAKFRLDVRSTNKKPPEVAASGGELNRS
jgi:hypothetical protein